MDLDLGFLVLDVLVGGIRKHLSAVWPVVLAILMWKFAVEACSGCGHVQGCVLLADMCGALLSPCGYRAPGLEAGSGFRRQMCLQSRSLGYFNVLSHSLTCCVHWRRRRLVGAVGAFA